MKKILLAALVLGLSSIAVAQFSGPRPGSEPYTPTKLEWLSVMLNAQHRRHIDGPNYFISLHFSAVPKQDELQVVVSYSNTAERVIVNKLAESGKEMAEGYARKVYGWDWVRITEKSSIAEVPLLQPPGR